MLFETSLHIRVYITLSFTILGRAEKRNQASKGIKVNNSEKYQKVNLKFYIELDQSHPNLKRYN